jgi:LacI family transcriptional regulator
VTIYDVAQAAGVAIGTASKALNDRGKLRPETRARVRAEAERLGFRANDLAHSLRRGRSFTVGLLATDRHGRLSLPLVTGIEDALGDARLSVFLCRPRDDPARERQHVESLLAKRVDGIMVVGARIDPRPPLDVSGAHVPVLYAFARSTDPRDACLVPDDAHGGALAARHLLGLGRRHFAHISGPTDWEAVQLRREGMLDALRERGLDCPAERILHGQWSEAWGYEAANRLLDGSFKIDALFCGSDRIGRGAIDALRERGVRIPTDVAVVGFDNWEVIAAATRPPLTTVDLELERLGRLAGQRLVAMIAGVAAEPGTVRHPCRLVVRASSGAAASADAREVWSEEAQRV